MGGFGRNVLDGCGRLATIVGVVLGIMSFIGALILSPPSRYHESPLFPIVRTSVEQMGPFTFAFLFTIFSSVGKQSEVKKRPRNSVTSWLLSVLCERAMIERSDAVETQRLAL
jgi:hypothetical protein